MRRVALTAAAISLAASSLVVGSSAAPAAADKGGQQPPYMSPDQPISRRVDDLMRRMTLEEKVGQMDQIVVGRLRATSDPGTGDCNGGNDATPQPSCLRRVLVDYRVGSILSGGTDNPPDNTGRGWAELYNTVQRYAIENSRLHIPILYGVDAVHGFGHPTDATLVPHQIGLGSSWDPELAQLTGDAVRRQLMAVGTRWNFAPVQDLARDNRWGRYYEPWSEDKLLAGTMGAANILGMQSARGDRLDVAATVKHFAAYGSSINGHDRMQAEIPIRYLQDTYLPSYAAAIDAGAATVMTQDGSINHIPAFASRYLQEKQLRDRLGFRGVLISDYSNITQLLTNTYGTASRPDRGGRADDQRRRRRLDDPERLPGLHRGRPGGRAARVDPAPAHQSGRRADPDAEVPPRPVREPVRRRVQGRRGDERGQGRRTPGGAGVDRPAAQPEQRAAAVERRSQAGGHRAERGQRLEPARRLERQLAGRLRHHAAVLRGPGRPDPAGRDRAQGHPGRRRAGHRGRVRSRSGRGGQRARLAPTRRSSWSARSPTPRCWATGRCRGSTPTSRR